MKPQTRTILALLRLYPHGLSALEALQMGGGFRLSGRILELRREGYQIDTTWETFGDSRYARYILREAPRQLGFGMTDNLSKASDTVPA